MAFKDIVAQWFKTNDVPTQTQFTNWRNYIRWKDEALAITEVSGLQSLLNQLATPVDVYTKTTISATPYFVNIPAGYMVETVLIEPTADCTITYTRGELPEDWDGETLDVLIGGDYEVLAQDVDVSADDVGIFSSKVRLKAGFKIGFYNVPASTVIRVIKRLVVPPILG